MNDKNKNIIMVIIFACLILTMSILSIFIKKDRYSMSERRALAEFPKMSVETIFSGDFSSDFETYATDNFYGRDFFRAVKNKVALYGFSMSDTNELYIEDGHISKLEYPENEQKVNETAEKIRNIYNKYINGKSQNVYLSVIPDKNMFLSGGRLSIDYDKFISNFVKTIDFTEYIDIVPLLSKDSYYKTDSHWKQECIVPVAEKILKGMGRKYKGSFSERLVKEKFYGVYSGQMSNYSIYDEIKVLSSKEIENAIVTSYDTGMPKRTEVYTEDKLSTADPYEVYMGGADALIKIENPLAKDDDHLIVFRDSFGSSLVPLLIGAYKNITVVDTRYIMPDVVGNFVDFKGADVLFIYSTTMINQSSILK